VEKIVQKPVEKSVEPAISDLFSTVKTNKPVAKVKDDGKRLVELNALEEKLLSTKRDSKLFEKAKTLELAKTGVKLSAVSGSSGPMVNEYKGKIQGIIYANFHPQAGTEGFSARVRITLSSDGKLVAYRVIGYSGSSVFNAEVDWLKERLGHIVLPSNPTGDDAVFEIILTAKD
jgi:membrane protein involved in colicin uptake